MFLNRGLKRIGRRTRIKIPRHQRTVETVGVGFPNPSGEETTMDAGLEFWCAGALSPRGAAFYRRGMHQIHQAPEGRHVFA